jgi:hypothetical protein
MGSKVMTGLGILWDFVVANGPGFVFWTGLGAVVGTILGLAIALLVYFQIRRRSFVAIGGKGRIWVPRIMCTLWLISGLLAGLVAGSALGAKGPTEKAVHHATSIAFEQVLTRALSDASRPALKKLKDNRLPISGAGALITDLESHFTGARLVDLGCVEAEGSKSQTQKIACAAAVQLTQGITEASQFLADHKLKAIEKDGNGDGLLGIHDVSRALADFSAAKLASPIIGQLNAALLIALLGCLILWLALTGLWAYLSKRDRRNQVNVEAVE